MRAGLCPRELLGEELAVQVARKAALVDERAASIEAALVERRTHQARSSTNGRMMLLLTR